MSLGLLGISLTAGYLLYLNYMSYDRTVYYEAINEDGSKTLRPKPSRWDS
jgi:hypothetical protein